MKSAKSKKVAEYSLPTLAAIQNRQCIRAFLDRPVDSTLIEQILNMARFAPSGVNHQPWHVACLQGATKQQLSATLIEARQADIKPNPDYDYYPSSWFEPYASRRKACGLAMYSALNINRNDIAKRQQVWELNYHFFGAPIGLIFFIDRKLALGSWLDLGMFLQNIMLAAQAFSLGTCPQASLAEYPDRVRETLALSTDVAIVCGMSLGYPDWTHPVNSYRLNREPLSQFVQWYD
jgi:nitroreductase